MALTRWKRPKRAKVFRMPKFQKHVKKICFYCRHYKMGYSVAHPKPGSYCEFHNSHFPNARGWVTDINIKKPGERTCNNWIR